MRRFQKVAPAIIVVAAAAAGLWFALAGQSFAPRLGTGAIAQAEVHSGKLVITVETNTVFPSNANPADNHVFSNLRVEFAGQSVTAQHIGARTDLRGNASDGSWQPTSVWIDTWRAVLAAKALPGPAYLIVMTACRHRGTECERTAVPVCVSGALITGMPGNVGDGAPRSFEYGRGPFWARAFTCQKPA